MSRVPLGLTIRRGGCRSECPRCGGGRTLRPAEPFAGLMMKLSAQTVGLMGMLSVLAACEKTDAPGSGGAARREAAPARSVRVTRVEARPMERLLQVVGTLSAHEEATVAAQVAGQIERAYVDVGDRTRAGQRMASIDTSAYQALVRQAAANLARAQARADNVRADAARGSSSWRRTASRRPASWTRRWPRPPRPRAEVKAAEAAAAIARLNLERSQVKAPFDGAVAERIASSRRLRGDRRAHRSGWCRSTRSACACRCPSASRPPCAWASRCGSPSRATARRHVGKVARIAPAIRESDRVLQVEADIPNQGGLRAGLFARAEIVISDQRPGAERAAPGAGHLRRPGEGRAGQGGKAIEKTVVTGRRGDGWIEIVSGLAAGDVGGPRARRPAHRPGGARHRAAAAGRRRRRRRQLLSRPRGQAAMQRLAEICIRRPVFAMMIILTLVVVGMAGYMHAWGWTASPRWTCPSCASTPGWRAPRRPRWSRRSRSPSRRWSTPSRASTSCARSTARARPSWWPPSTSTATSTWPPRTCATGCPP